MRYFITFVCYGSHLHGRESGSVDRHHNLPGTPLLEPDSPRATKELRRMAQGSYCLDRSSREAVLEAMREACIHRGWSLLAAHVRTNHVHAIVEAEVAPERVMNTFKSYASRRLNRKGGGDQGKRRWAHHGSTRRLWKDEDVRQALRYVVDEQGEPMAVFVADGL